MDSYARARRAFSTPVRKAMVAFLAIICALSLALPLQLAFAANDGEAAATPAVADQIHGVTDLDLLPDQVDAFRVSDSFLQDGAQSLYISVEKVVGDERIEMLYREKWTESTAVAQGASQDRAAAEVPVDEARQNGERIARIVTLGLGETEALFKDGATYDITVYTEPVGGEAACTLTLYPVYAQLTAADGTSSLVLMGTRSQKQGEAPVQNLGAGATYYKMEGSASVPYGIADPNASSDYRLGDGCFVVDYIQQTDQATQAQGSVTYVTPEGEVVRVETFNLNPSGTTEVPVDRSFLKDGKYYRAISNLGASAAQLSLQNANKMVKVMQVANRTANAYQAVIEYQDTDGRELWTDTLEIKGSDGQNQATYRYALPHSFSMADTDGVILYTYPGQTATLEATTGGSAVDVPVANDGIAHVIDFDSTLYNAVNPSDDPSQPAQLNIVARYDDSAKVNKEVPFTLVEVDGQTGKRLGEQKLTVTPDQPQTYTPSPREFNGKRYVPWSGNVDAMTFEWEQLSLSGTKLMQTVYYVPEDWVPQAYDVTVRYMDILGGRVLKTESIAMDPDANEFMDILGPEQFDLDGETYVRLPGQEDPIRHAFPTGEQTYTLYYRNVNDVLNANTVVHRTEIIDTAAPATEDAGPSLAAVPAGEGDDAAPAGVAAGDGTAVINDDNNPLANLDGEDTATERIEDEANPLASGQEGSASASVALYAGLGLGAVALIALMALLLLRRRRQQSDDRAEL